MHRSRILLLSSGACFALHGCSPVNPCPRGFAPDHAEDRCTSSAESIARPDGGDASGFVGTLPEDVLRPTDASSEVHFPAIADAGPRQLLDAALGSPEAVDASSVSEGTAESGIDAARGAPPADLDPTVRDAGDPRTPSSWTELPGGGFDVAVSERGDVWVVGFLQSTDGTSIHRWLGDDWIEVAGGAKRIAVDPAGLPWIVTESGKIFRRTSSDHQQGDWQPVPGCAIDLSVGADGDVWSVSCATDAGTTAQRWSGSEWIRSDATGTRIAVGSLGAVWLTDGQGRVLQRAVSDAGVERWTELPVMAADIAADKDGAVFILGPTVYDRNYVVHELSPDGGTRRVTPLGAGTNLAVNTSGIWLTNSLLWIYRLPR